MNGLRSTWYILIYITRIFCLFKKSKKKIQTFYIFTTTARAKIDRATSTTGVFELVEWCRYVTGCMEFDLTPLPSTTDVSFVYNTATTFVTLHSSSSSNFQMNFARSRPSRYRWYDLLLCAAPLMMVYNLTPWYHGCSNSTSLDHSMSMETSQRHFTIVSGAFLGNVFDQDTRRPWERRSIGQHRQRLFLSWLSGAGTSQEVWSLI